MTDIEFYIGTMGPFLLPDTDPLVSDSRQVVRQEDVSSNLDDTDIVDNLTTNDATKVLSAKQGKVLKDLYDALLEHKDMVQMVNKTGAASVKGTVVTISTSEDNAVDKIVVDVPSPIGVIYEDGIADGSLVWVVVTGKAQVLFIGDTNRGHLARGFVNTDAGYVSGYALSELYPVAPFATDKHFYEIGHVTESRIGAGLAWCILHNN